jgi:hypothetical protein
MSRLGAFLVQEGILSAADRQMIKRESAAYHGSFARSVLAMGLLDEDELTALMASKTGCLQVAKDIMHDLDPAVATLVPLHVLAWLEVVPLSVNDGLLRLAMVDTTDQDAINQVRFFTGLRIKPMIAKLSEIHRALQRIGAPMDIGESGFEGLLRTLGRPPLPATSRNSTGIFKQNDSPMSNAREMVAPPAAASSSVASSVPAGGWLDDGFQELNDDSDLAQATNQVAAESVSSDLGSDPSVSANMQEIAAPQYYEQSVQTDMGPADEQAMPAQTEQEVELLTANAEQTANLDATLNGELSEPTEKEDQIDEIGALDVAAQNLEASQTPADFDASGQDVDLSLDTSVEVQPEETLNPEFQSDESLEASTDFPEDFESGETVKDGSGDQTNSFEPQFGDHQDIPGDVQPEISGIEATAANEPDLDLIGSEDVTIESSSHAGIAHLNRVLISLQVTTDMARALTKIADVACRVGIGQGLLAIVRANNEVVGVRWVKDGTRSDVYLELPEGHNEASLRTIVEGREPDAWFDHSDVVLENVTHALVMRPGTHTAICLASFTGSSNHEGLRQTFADVIRAVPVD